jgi:hypothetical protein
MRRGWGIFGAVLLSIGLAEGGLSVPAARGNETVMVCDIYGDHLGSQAPGLYGIGTSQECPGNPETGPPNTGGMAIWTGGDNTIQQGTAVHWTVTAPAGLTIASVYIPHMYSEGIDDNTGWGGGFFWSGGSGESSTYDGETGWSTATTSGPAFTWPAGGSPYFGWQVVCGVSSCSNGGHQWLSVELLELNVEETNGPFLLAPTGLWQAQGWIRGTWPLRFVGDSPSGLCSMTADLNGQALPGVSVPNDPAVWHQCQSPTFDENVNTAQYGDGVLPLTISAVDAVGYNASHTELVRVDNQTPTISLSGPTDAPSTSGTQYITATAGAGPSGVAGISCSLDGAPAEWHAGASAQIAVQGIGVHQLSCTSESNARDSSGTPASSRTATWTLSIRTPSVATASFARVVDSLRCKATVERVRIPAHWATAYHGSQRIRVKVPAQTRRVKVVHCHPRLARKRVRVDGHWRVVTTVVLPRSVERASTSVRAGASTTLNGWLGTTSGNALGSQTVRILTAPDNGSQRFTQAALATTGADGAWSARIPAGPSRLIVAQYDGSATVEPATSAPARVEVPGSLVLRIRPRLTHWGKSIAISGQLSGGYIPSSGELVILWIGWHSGSTEIGHLYTDAHGRFHSTYTFLRGNGRETYRLWAATARESDYPYAPGRSRPVAVTVES